MTGTARETEVRPARLPGMSVLQHCKDDDVNRSLFIGQGNALRYATAAERTQGSDSALSREQIFSHTVPHLVLRGRSNVGLSADRVLLFEIYPSNPSSGRRKIAVTTY